MKKFLEILFELAIGFVAGVILTLVWYLNK